MGKSIFEPINTKEEWKRTKKAIKINGFSVSAVCKEADMSPSTPLSWDKDDVEPSPRKVNDIKAALARMLERRDKQLKEIK